MRATILAVTLVFGALIMKYGALMVFRVINLTLFVAIMCICAVMIWYVVRIKALLSSDRTEVPAGQKRG